MTRQRPFATDPDSVDRDMKSGLDGLTLLEQSPASPIRSLRWRWIVAVFLARTGSRTRLPWIDGPVRRAARHIVHTERPGKSCRARAAAFDPAISRAMALRAAPIGQIRTAVEAMLLAGMDGATTAGKLGLGPEVVAAYHDLFFDVGPILARSDAIILRALGERVYTGPMDLPLAVRLLSDFGGPVVARSLVEAVLLPGTRSPEIDHAGLARDLEDYLLACSLPEDGRGLATLLGLVADPGPQRGVATVAAVTGPIVVDPTEVPIPAGSGLPVRAEGSIRPLAGRLVRAGCAPETGDGLVEGTRAGASSPLGLAI